MLWYVGDTVNIWLGKVVDNKCRCIQGYELKYIRVYISCRFGEIVNLIDFIVLRKMDKLYKNTGMAISPES